MLDNYPTPAALSDDAGKLKEAYPHVTVEASGGITRDTLKEYCRPSVGGSTRGMRVHNGDVGRPDPIVSYSNRPSPCR